MQNSIPCCPDAESCGWSELHTTPLLRFEVIGKPVAWKRPQQARSGHRFTDKKVDAYQTRVADAAAAAMGNRAATAAPVTLNVTAVLPIPPSWPKWKQTAAMDGSWLAVSRPDFDNFVKGVADALNCIVYADDAQIVEANIRKHYGSRPRLIVTVGELEQAASPRTARTAA